jgi:hypothetical protein
VDGRNSKGHRDQMPPPTVGARVSLERYGASADHSASNGVRQPPGGRRSRPRQSTAGTPRRSPADLRTHPGRYRGAPPTAAPSPSAWLDDLPREPLADGSDQDLIEGQLLVGTVDNTTEHAQESAGAGPQIRTTLLTYGLLCSLGRTIWRSSRASLARGRVSSDRLRKPRQVPLALPPTPVASPRSAEEAEMAAYTTHVPSGR